MHFWLHPNKSMCIYIYIYIQTTREGHAKNAQHSCPAVLRKHNKDLWQSELSSQLPYGISAAEHHLLTLLLHQNGPLEIPNSFLGWNVKEFNRRISINSWNDFYSFLKYRPTHTQAPITFSPSPPPPPAALAITFCPLGAVGAVDSPNPQGFAELFFVTWPPQHLTPDCAPKWKYIN